MVGSNEHAQLREALEFCLEKDLERILRTRIIFQNQRSVLCS